MGEERMIHGGIASIYKLANNMLANKKITHLKNTMMNRSISPKKSTFIHLEFKAPIYKLANSLLTC